MWCHQSSQKTQKSNKWFYPRPAPQKHPLLPSSRELNSCDRGGVQRERDTTNTSHLCWNPSFLMYCSVWNNLITSSSPSLTYTQQHTQMQHAHSSWPTGYNFVSSPIRLPHLTNTRMTPHKQCGDVMFFFSCVLMFGYHRCIHWLEFLPSLKHCSGYVK